MKSITTYGMAGALALGILLSMGAATARAQDLRCQIGLLTPATLAGNNPATGQPWKAGDEYRFVFLTSTAQRAWEHDITWYDNLIQNLANASSLPIGVENGVTWRIIGSTDAVNARDHTKTNPLVDGVGCAIYLLNGQTVMAKDNAELWSGTIQNVVTTSETGGAPGTVWPYTGTRRDGTRRDGSSPDRAPLGGNRAWGQGNAGASADWVWRVNTGRNNQDHSFYGLSDPLTIQAPPATIISIR